MDRRESEALDRHITGNYGEDQFQDDPEPEIEWDCPQCGQGIEHHTDIEVEYSTGTQLVYECTFDHIPVEEPTCESNCDAVPVAGQPTCHCESCGEWRGGHGPNLDYCPRCVAREGLE